MTRWKAWAALWLAVMTAVLSGLFALGLSEPQSALAPPLASSYAAQASGALSAGNLAGALRVSEAEVAQAPMSSSGWARRAYLRQQGARVLDGAALHDLAMSYNVAPLGPDISPWRLRFAFENWDKLTPALRQRATDEMRNYASFHKGSALLADSVQNPAGKLAASLTIRQAYAQASRSLGDSHRKVPQ